MLKVSTCRRRIGNNTLTLYVCTHIDRECLHQRRALQVNQPYVHHDTSQGLTTCALLASSLGSSASTRRPVSFAERSAQPAAIATGRLLLAQDLLQHHKALAIGDLGLKLNPRRALSLVAELAPCFGSFENTKTAPTSRGAPLLTHVTCLYASPAALFDISSFVLSYSPMHPWQDCVILRPLDPPRAFPTAKGRTSERLSY